MRWCDAQSITFDVEVAAGAPIETARDLLAAAFLAHKGKFERMLMIDAGIGFEPEVIEKLLKASLAGNDFVAACAPLRRSRVDRACERAAEGFEAPERYSADFIVDLVVQDEEASKPNVQIVEGAPFAATKRIGGSCWMLTKTVFERVYETFPELQHRDGFAYFKREIVEGEYYGEDSTFCWRWRQAGGEIWTLLDAPLVHEGHGVWTGNLGLMFG